MKNLKLKLIECISTHCEEDSNGVVHYEDITYLLEGGLSYSVEKCYNEYVDRHTRGATYSLTGNTIPVGNFSKSIHNDFEFEVVSEMLTSNWNSCTIFRVNEEFWKKLFSCYQIGDNKIIKDDAIWALSNLNLK